MTPSPNEDPAPPPIPPSAPQHIPQMPPPLERKKSVTNKSLTLPWILGIVAVGGLCCLSSVILTKIRIGHVDTSYKTGEMVGAAIGWFLIALVVCGILALFKSFRQNPRRLAIVAIIIWALIGLSNIAQLNILLSHGASDKAAADDFGREIDRLKKQAAQTTDPQKMADIQRQMREKMQRSGENLSPDMRKEQQAAMNLLAPYQNLSIAYSQKIAAFSKIEGGWLSVFSKSPEALAAGRTQVKELVEENKNLLNALNVLVAEIDRRLKTKDTSGGIGLEMLAGIKSSFDRNASNARQLYGMEAKVLDDIDGVLKLLQDNPTSWERQDGDDSVISKDDAFQQQLQTLLDDIQRTLKQKEIIRQQLLRTPTAR